MVDIASKFCNFVTDIFTMEQVILILSTEWAAMHCLNALKND